MGGGRVQPVMWQEASRGLRWKVQEEISRHALKFHREEAVWLSVMPAQWQRLLVSSRKFWKDPSQFFNPLAIMSHSLWMTTKRISMMCCQTSWNWILNIMMKLPNSWIEPEIYLFIFIYLCKQIVGKLFLDDILSCLHSQINAYQFFETFIIGK